MTSVSMIAVIAFFWIRFRASRGCVVPSWLAAYRPTRALAYACTFALVPLFVLQGWVLVEQAHFENLGAMRALEQLPIPVYDGRSANAALHTTYSLVALVLGVCESFAVAIVVLAARTESRGLARAMSWTVAALALVAVCTPALATTDPYEYVAAALLGIGAYAPPAHVFTGTIYEQIFPVVPLRGVIYGPLWLALDTLKLAFVPTIVGKIVALRLINVALVFLTADLFRRAGVARIVSIALVVNPATWYYVVLSPHADIEGLVAIAGAFLAVARSRPYLAMILIGAAGLIKFPFVLAGAAAFAPLSSVRQRALLCVGAGAIVVIASFLVPHNAYAVDVKGHLPIARQITGFVLFVSWIVVASLALIATTVLVVTGRAAGACAWFFGQLAPLGAPWYLLWGLPYALASGSATALLVSFPLVAWFADPNFGIELVAKILMSVCMVGYAFDVLRHKRAGARLATPASIATNG